MNKDFLSKTISLKDIDFKSIKLKSIKKKKEIIIGILFVVYVIAVIIIGKNLISTRAELEGEYAKKEQRANSLKQGDSEEEIQRKIDDLEIEKENLNNAFYAITPAQFTDILSDFKRNSPITWDDKDVDVSIMPVKPEYSSYDVFSVYVKSFSGSFNQVKEFLGYVKNYDKIVRLDSINFRRDDVTGNMKGAIKLSFYFKKMAE